MHGSVDHPAHGVGSSVARFVLVLIVMLATVLGVRLALDYPKWEPDCGPQAGAAFVHCDADRSLVQPRPATGPT